MTKPETSISKQNAIVACCTPNWLPLACCTLLSCADHGANSVADLIIVTTGATTKEIEKVYHHFERRGQKIVTVNEALPASFNTLVQSGTNVGAFLRLAIDHYLPSKYERVLYLDSDILALGPVSKVVNSDLKGKALGAVEDWHSMPGPMRVFQDHPRKLKFNPADRYFNSGVLLMDWRQVLKKGLLQKAVETWSKRIQKGENLFFPDQDMLNLAFYGDWQPLPIAMNASSVIVDHFPENISLRHFTAHYKPWTNYWMPGLAPYKDEYRKLLNDSPWIEFQVKDFSKIDVKEVLGVWVRRLDAVSRARYRRHVSSGLA